MTPSLDIDDVSYRFGRRGAVAVRQTSVGMTGPGVYGLLGPNGAGKTTLMRMAAGVTAPQTGSCRVGGADIHGNERRQVLRRTGYLPQDSPLVPSLSVRDFLWYVAWLKMVERSETEAVIAELASEFELDHVLGRRMGSLSGGERRRVGLAQAFVNHPRVVILDEPTAGLDPYHRVRIRDSLTTRGQSSLILVSTHLVEDVVSVCKGVMIMIDGVVKLFSPLTALGSGGSVPTVSELEQVYMGFHR